MSKLFIFICICFAPLTAALSVNRNPITFNGDISTELSAERKILKFVTSGVADIFWYNVFDHLHRNDSSVSFECHRSLLNIFNGIENGYIWAFKFVDATAKSPSGILDGSTSSLGDYDQCLNIEVIKSDIQFNGKYCSLQLVAGEDIKDGIKNDFAHKTVRVEDNEFAVRRMISQYNSCPENIPFRVGLCIPSTCTHSDIHNLVTTALHHYSWNVYAIANCDTMQSISFKLDNMTTIQLLSLILVFSFIVMVSFATIVDILSLNALMHTKVVNNFSAIKNTMKLFDDFERKRIPIIDTCRLTLILVEIALHSNTFSGLLKGLALMSRKEDAMLYTNQLWFQPYNLIFGESIFAVGGMTAALSLIPLLESRNVIKACIKNVIKRWFRFTAITLFAIALQMIWQFTNSGPVFNEFMKQQVDVCSQHWWTNILYINNLIKPSDYCLPHTWSVAAEFQLYLLAVLTIILLSKSEKVGLIFSAIMMLIGMVMPAIYTYINDFRPIGIYPLDFSQMENQFYYIYLSTSSHTTTYFAFLMANYLKVYHFKTNVESATKWKMSIVTAIAFLLSMYLPLPWNLFPIKMGVIAATTYTLFVRLLFTLFPVWVYFLKIKSPLVESTSIDANANISANGANNGKRRRRVPKVFRALIRLVASMYYAHSMYIYWDSFSTRTAVSWSPLIIAKRSICGICFGIISGYLFHIFIESPLNNLFFAKAVEKKKLQ